MAFYSRQYGDDEDGDEICLRSGDGTEISTSSDSAGYLAAMPIPVDDDETFAKNIYDNKDDSDLSTADRGASERRILLVAQQPQEENTNIRLLGHNPTIWIDADVHVNLSHMQPLLSEYQVNDDSGRFLPNGGNSLPMQYHKGNVGTNDPLPGSTVVEENIGLLFFAVTSLFSQLVSPCLTGQKLRKGLCCWTTRCEDEGFLPCQTQNGTDVCEQCLDGEYVRGEYPTSGFKSSPCVEIPRCLQEEIRDDSGKCVCNRAEGYIRRLDNCEPTDIKCDKPGIELSEKGFCEPCKENFYKDINSNDLCTQKGNITCSSGQIVNNGNTMSDRTCIEVTTVIQRITTENSITTTNNLGSSNGLNVSVIIGIAIGCILLVVIVIVVIYNFYKKIQGKQQSENIDITERGESTPLNKNYTKEDESQCLLSFRNHRNPSYSFYGGDIKRDQKAKADPVDDDETFVKELEDSNDDNLLSRAAGGAPETEFNILSAQQPQGEQTDTRPIVYRPTAREEAQVHVEQSPQLLTENPENDDSGRLLLNGETSLSMQYHNGNVNH